jgi:hypothetical protein
VIKAGLFDLDGNEKAAVNLTSKDWVKHRLTGN